MHHINNMEEVCSHDVHFVDICHTGDLVLISLTPHGFGLRFNTALCAKNRYRTVKHSQGAFDFNGKVNVTGGIDDSDAVILPIAGGSSGGDCYTSFLLLCHPVHLC